MNSSVPALWATTVDRIQYQITTALPPLVIAAGILLVTFALARAVRWLLRRTFEGRGVDRLLRQSGIHHLLPFRKSWRSGPMIADGAYFAILILGLLFSLGVLDTYITTRFVEAVIILIPKLLVAAVLFVAALWLSEYLGRGMLVWAVNEGLPYPRRWALAVRVLVAALGVVVVSETLQFAPRAFFATYLAGLIGGLVAGTVLLLRRKTQREAEEQAEPAGRSLWNHL